MSRENYHREGDYTDHNSTTGRENGDSSSSFTPSDNRGFKERQEQVNPFSFKHFLKRDCSSSSCSGSTAPPLIITNTNPATVSNSTPSVVASVSSSVAEAAAAAAAVAGSSNISHSRSTSIINGTSEAPAPAKSATTSALNHTGARPKIPQFQSVSHLGAESKMKRSPRFPSFDSQSSLSELSDDKAASSDLLHSRSNSSFTSETPVQRSFSHYEIDSPASPEKLANHTASPRVARHVNSEFSAALPDFVQDHLVMEQWYTALGSPKGSTSPVSVDLERLQDFASAAGQSGSNTGRNIDLPFDLTFNSTPSVRKSSPIVPFEVPNHVDFDFGGPRTVATPPPSDLPPDLTTRRSTDAYGFMNLDPAPQQQQGALPDFLSDGPIHSSARLADVAQLGPDDTHESATAGVVARLQDENDRLQNELDNSRHIIVEQTRRIIELEQMVAARAADALYGGLNGRSTDSAQQRDGAGQSLVNKLKQQIKQLNAEVESLRRENESLREEGAVGGAGVRGPLRVSRTQQLSRDLRLAASTAESNLRQLLTGVDNLRLIAATIENLDRATAAANDPIEDFLSDDGNDNDFAGL